MSPKIKVHRINIETGEEEITEEDPEEVQRMVDNCHQWQRLALNTQTNEVIREVTPDITEITIYFPELIAGG